MNRDNRQHTGERDDVATLLRVAGKRRPVSTERAERVRAAVHAQWQAETARPSRQRYVWAAAALATAALLVLAITLRVGPGGTPPVEVAGVTGDSGILVEAIVGDASVHDTSGGSPSSARALTSGQSLAAGSEITTSEAGRVALRLVSNHSIRLDVSTRTRLLGAGTIDLRSGAIYIDSGPDSEGTSGVVVQTPYGVVHEIGTQFEVRLSDDAIRVRLREGAVILSRGGRNHEVAAGTELEIASDDTATTRTISTHGPEWEWTTAVTPMPALEGRPAREFLDWVAREAGLELEFHDETLARRAEEIVVEGSLTGLTPAQSLDAVLPTCRMAYRVENGVLRITSDE